MEEMRMASKIRLNLGAALLALAMGSAAYAADTIHLKWAHVYESDEPFHRQALWAAEEIARRSNGGIDIKVFPAAQLGTENQLNDGLGLGTIDIIYTGAAFAGTVYPPISIAHAPYVFRDYEHWQAYRASPLFAKLGRAYHDTTGHEVVALTYYGQRHLTANRAINTPEDMRGMKLRIPPVPVFLVLTKATGAVATPIAFADVYDALRQGKVDGQENPLPTIKAKKFDEVQSHIMLTGHVTDSLLTLVGGHIWNGLADDQKTLVTDVLRQAAERASEEIRQSERELPDQFRAEGLTVVDVDRQPFFDAVRPLLTEWLLENALSIADFDTIQGL